MNQPAIVNYSSEPHSVRLEEIPVPDFGDQDILMEVAAVGVCGSDLHQWTGEHSWPVNYPVVLGHEFAGVIHSVGRQVSGWKEGDRVCSETAAVIDPSSPMTRTGRYNLDPNRKGFGYGVNGAMTRYVRVPSRCLHRVPDSLPLSRAALTEPCCVAYSAVAAQVNILPGDRILVLGPGPIGLLCGAIARLRGAQVAVAGLPRDAKRLAIAKSLGCEALTENLDQWARARDGLGCDGVVDAAGISATLKSAIDLVRPGGWISKVGWGRSPLNFSLDPLVQKNITLQGSFSHNWQIWERVLALLDAGQLEAERIVGGRWDLEHWHEAFETMHHGDVAKSLLVVNPSTAH
ncbi:MAG: zinc-binding dehydrogenase [Pirellulaceae bacterium]